MFTEILKIIPKMDAKDLNAMQKQLQSRFTKIAKSFGKGLTSVLKGGGIAGIALGLIDKLLNPLKEVQEAIDRTLSSSDDLATNAKQFNSTTGKLAKLAALGEATGLDQDSLFTLINKFQNATAEAKQDPSKPSAVRNFTNNPDAVANFFDFIQSLQKMNKNDQLLVQQEVFGEKQILKMADFLQSDFTKLYSKIGLNKISSEVATEKIDKLAGLKDRTDELSANRNFFDRINKAGVINEGMVNSRNASEKLALQRQDQQIAAYKNLAMISDSMEKVMILIESGVSALGGFIPKATKFIDDATMAIQGWMKSPMMRGVKGLFGGKGN